jgi:hypothetical protein
MERDSLRGLDGPKRVPPRAHQIDFARPEKCKVLKSILEGAHSGVEARVLMALYDMIQGFSSVLSSDQKLLSRDHADAAAYLLEQGLMQPIAEGLEAVLRGYIVYLPRTRKDLEAVYIDEKNVYVNKGLAFVESIFTLAADSRTVRFMLRVMPTLPATLASLFLKKPTRQESMCPIPLYAEMKREIVRALLAITAVSENGRAQIGRNTGLISSIVRYVDEGTGRDEQLLRNVFFLVSNVVKNHRSAVHDLRVDYLNLFAKVLADSMDGPCVRWALENATDLIGSFEGGEWPLSCDIRSLFSSLLGLVLCDKADDSLRTLAAELAASLKGCERLGKPISAVLSKDEKLTAIKKLAQKDSTAVKRAGQFSVIFSDDLASAEIIGITRHPIVVPLSQGTEFRVIGTTALRKCACSGCDKVEESPGSFSVCAGCRLSVFCSRGKMQTDQEHRSYPAMQSNKLQLRYLQWL